MIGELLFAFMEAGPLHRDSRTVPRGRAALWVTLVILVAALLRLMGCVHGATSADHASSFRDAPVAVAVGHTDSEPGPERQCCHDDEPTIQAPRNRDTVLAAQSAQSSYQAAPVTGVAGGSALVPWPGRPPGSALAEDLSIGRSLARLGVWRT